jgi:hypothetical protein
MSLGVFLMLLQATSEFFKDVLRLRGERPFKEGDHDPVSGRSTTQEAA